MARCLSIARMSATSSTKPAAPAPLFGRLLLTGAAGALGRVLRPRLARLCGVLRLSDIAPMDVAGAHEETVVAALQDRAAVDAIVAGCDAIAHFGGISVEGPFEPILQANIIGVWNLYEAARRRGVKRIVLASSNHVTGFYRRDELVSADDPLRPDGHYGVSKAFGENLSRFHFDRYGIQTVCLRIGSSFPEPRDRRMLDTWLSYDDLERLVVASLSAPDVGHTVIYGVSDNTTTWWNNGGARHIGFQALDSSERFRAEIERTQPRPDPDDPAERFQGGAFVAKGPY
jgi:uronate dehydrogenase